MFVRSAVQRSTDAREWLDAVEADELDAHVPELLYAEVGSSLLKYVRAEQMTAADAVTALETVVALPLRAHRLGELAPSALALAVESGLSVYDCCYAVLAGAIDGPLVTADRKLAAAVRTGGATHVEQAACVRFSGERPGGSSTTTGPRGVRGRGADRRHNFLAVRFSNRELDPLWGAGLRFALAAAVFGISAPRCACRSRAAACSPWSRPTGSSRSRRLRVPLLGAAGGAGRGRRGRDGGRAAADAAARGRARAGAFNARAAAGAVIAVAGSALIFFQPGSVDFGWTSFVLLGFAALAAAESVVVSKRCGRQHPAVMNSSA